MIGRKFEMLTVMDAPVQKDKNGMLKYLCECECGNRKYVYGAALRNGTAVSCGCYRKKRKERQQTGKKNVEKPRYTGQIRTDCAMFVRDDVKTGCSGLNKLLCKVSNKPCAFYKQSKIK